MYVRCVALQMAAGTVRMISCHSRPDMQNVLADQEENPDKMCSRG